MPRTKGSKNKPKTVTADFAFQIVEKQSERKALSTEIASITANVDSLKAIDKEIVKLEAKKTKADADNDSLFSFITVQQQAMNFRVC